MRNILIDAGPMIALFDKDDTYHSSVMNFLKDFSGHLHTTWPVITETAHTLSFNSKAQISFLEWLKRGALHVENLEKKHLDRIIELMEEYSDLPIDLADSSLLIISETTGINEIATLDSDCYVYRLKDKKALKNVLFD